jgi:hypothetical protein
MMVFEFVHSTTFGALQHMRIAFVGGITPPPTVMALGHTWVHLGGLYGRSPASDINSAIDKGHSPLAVL